MLTALHGRIVESLASSPPTTPTQGWKEPILILADGHRNQAGTDYFATIHDGLADDFQELCSKIGFSCRQKVENLSTNFKKNARLIRCLVRKFNSANVKQQLLENYDGDIFGIGTKSGWLVLRRNKLVSVSGSCF